MSLTPPSRAGEYCPLLFTSASCSLHHGRWWGGQTRPPFGEAKLTPQEVVHMPSDDYQNLLLCHLPRMKVKQTGFKSPFTPFQKLAVTLTLLGPFPVATIDHKLLQVPLPPRPPPRWQEPLPTVPLAPDSVPQGLRDLVLSDQYPPPPHSLIHQGPPQAPAFPRHCGRYRLRMDLSPGLLCLCAPQVQVFTPACTKCFTGVHGHCHTQVQQHLHTKPQTHSCTHKHTHTELHRAAHTSAHTVLHTAPHIEQYRHRGAHAACTAHTHTLTHSYTHTHTHSLTHSHMHTHTLTAATRMHSGADHRHTWHKLTQQLQW